MKRRIAPITGVILGLFLMVLYVNCDRPAKFQEHRTSTTQNTVAGNPMVANKILDSVCAVITRCHSEITSAQCRSSVLAIKGFDAPLGLPSVFSTLASISQAEASGALQGTSAADSCQQAIESLSCLDPVAAKAFDASSADPFSGAVNLVTGPGCGAAVSPLTKLTCSERVFIRGVSNPILRPVASAAQGVVYSISPALPAGLELNTITGEISGAPSAVSPLSEYTLTGSGPGGSSSSVVKIKTADGYLVNDLGDASNAGGPTCAIESGACTLRAAIEAAMTASSPKVIVAPAGTVRLTSLAPLNISKPVEIYGDCENGTVVDGLGQTSIFSITAGPTTLDHLTVQNGYGQNQAGVGISISASTGTFEAKLSHVTVRNNKINGSNTGMSDGAGIHVFGQSASSQVILKLTDCVIADNSNLNGNFGGGVGLWTNTQAEIVNCTFSGNQSTSYGGGLSSRDGRVNISQSLFVNNIGGGEGGGIFIDHYASQAASIANVTFAGNTADAGGAIYIGGGGMTIKNTTFSGNRARASFYGGALAPQVAISVANSLFSDSLAAGVAMHCSGNHLITSRGHNLSDGAADDCSLIASGDLALSTPLLAPLRDNGGATLTMALLAGSSAFDNADPALCPALDQRGALRLAGGRCDIGAFEAQ